jgi:hypothetical protein
MKAKNGKQKTFEKSLTMQNSYDIIDKHSREGNFKKSDYEDLEN